MNDSTSMRVALYACVSAGTTLGHGQVRENKPVAVQLTEMREFAAQRGWTVATEFVDAGGTPVVRQDPGQAIQRPNLRDLLAAVEDEERRTFDAILVYSLAYLSSSFFDALTLFELLGRHSVGFASVREPQFDLSTPTGHSPLTFLADLDRYYLDLLLDAGQVRQRRARRNLYSTSVPHYGYQHSGDPATPPVVVEEEAAAVRLAFERYATGKRSYQDIADELNEAGFRTRRGRRFSKETVSQILSNPFYAGQVVYDEGRQGGVAKVYPGKHEAIVSEPLWNAARIARDRHRRVARKPQRQVEPYLLSRIAYCHICGRKLRTQTTPQASFYREMAGTRAHEDCPNRQIGVHAEVLHRQIGAIVREIRLPPDWQEELAQVVAEKEDAAFQDRRGRLLARRRRLKEAHVRGDFEEDEDIYRRELAWVRRELDRLPSEEELFQVNQAAELLGSLADVWDDADPADQRELIWLMLQEAQVDVVQGRLLFLRPASPFVPLFRALPLLRELEPGTFTPAWSEEVERLHEGDLLPYPALPPLTTLPEELADPLFLPTWPWQPSPRARISPFLSDALKARRRAGREGGIAITVPHPGVPPVLLDFRRWQEVSLEKSSLSEALERPEGSVAFLDTPLAVQSHPAREQLARAVFQLLEQKGHWHLVDVAPAAMPAHWLFAFFPEVWPYVKGSFWTSHGFYNALRRAGFQVKQREHTFCQPVALDVALEIARRRPDSLVIIPDALYEEGVRRLEAVVGEQGNDALVPSEVTVVEVTAVKSGGRVKKRGGRKKKG